MSGATVVSISYSMKKIAEILLINAFYFVNDEYKFLVGDLISPKKKT